MVVVRVAAVVVGVAGNRKKDRGFQVFRCLFSGSGNRKRKVPG